MRFGAEDRLCRAESLLSTELDQETVLMSLDAGAYYGLAGPARTIWETLASSMTFSALVARLVRQYQVSPETCAADVEKFLQAMQREGLLHVE